MDIDIEKIKRKLLIKYPFFGSIVANTTFVEDKNCFSNGSPTAGTDGSNIYYHPDFVESISDNEQLFLFAHEVCHIAFDHISRSKEKDPELWNIATDGVINALLKKDGLPLMDNCINIPEAINYDAEELYNILLEKKKNNNEQKENNESNASQDMENNKGSMSQDGSEGEKGNKDNSKEGNSNFGTQDRQQNESNKNNNVGHDTHSMWQKVLEQEKNNSENSKEDGNSETSSQNKSQEENSENNNSKSTENENNSMSQEALENDNKDSKKDKNYRKNTKNKLQTPKTSDTSDKSSKSKDKQSNKKQKRYNKDDDISLENKNNSDKTKMQEKVKTLVGLGEKKAFKQNKIDRKKQLEELREVLVQESLGAGNNSSNEYREVSDIGISKPLIDWRRLLREAIKYDIDWSYQNATIEYGVITPHLEEFPRPEAEILLDTSGSISEVLLKNFLRECKNILQNSKVKVGCFDVRFYGFTEIKNVFDIDNMKFIGGGGTNFDVAVNAFSRRVENKIIFTDGEADMPEKAIDAIWVVFGNKNIKPKGGKVIYINELQLRSLYNFRDENEVSSRKRRR